MAEYDLSTYEGRQAARDAGNWVGEDSSGNIVMEPLAGGGTTTTTTGSTSTSGSAGVMYQTVNGPKTLAQMQSELYQAGWPGGEDVATAYARTTKGAVTVGTGAEPPPGQPPLPTIPTTNVEGVNAQLELALKKAYQEYLNAKLNLETDQFAFTKAQTAFQNSLAEAGLLGTYKGQQTLAAQLQQANMLGTYQGQPTLAAQQQYFQQALAQQTQNQKVVQDYLTLLSGLRGPQDYGQYLRVMASTPGGLQDLVRGAAGQMPMGFGTTGVQPQAVTLGGFMGAAAGAGGVPGVPGATPGTTYEQYQAAVRNLPPPSQIAPQNWNAMTDVQKRLLLGMYESAGWNVTDAQQQYLASLPKYGSPSPQSGTFRLV